MAVVLERIFVNRAQCVIETGSFRTDKKLDNVFVSLRGNDSGGEPLWGWQGISTIRSASEV